MQWNNKDCYGEDMILQLREYFVGLKPKQTCQPNPCRDALDCVTKPLALVSPATIMVGEY